jgi:hypothetical protein
MSLGATRFHVDHGTHVTAAGHDGRLLMHMDSLRTCTLNPIGSRVWSLLEAWCSVDEIVESLSQEFEAPPSAIARDVRRFLAELLAKGFIVPAGADYGASPTRVRPRG